ncbi:MAG: hypothetical protein ACI4N4_02015 [Candidatus Fimenecus sp.]
MKSEKRQFKLFDYRPVPEDKECKQKKCVIKENGKEKEFFFTYLSKKQMKQYIRQGEKENPDIYSPRIEGYFRLKKSRDKVLINSESHTEIHTVDARVGIKGTDFDVHYKPKVFHRVKGYIFTKEDNIFLALEKITVLPLIILALLFGIGLYSFIPHTPDIPDLISEWIPNIDENIGNKVDGEKVKAGNIKINGFSKWTVPAGQTENISVPFTNPKENRCYFQFTITLDETGEVLYESQLVPPGEGIYSVNINRPLDAGNYDATIFITTKDVETGGDMNSCKFNTTIMCK